MKQRFAVIGHPIGHTMSPFIHNSLFDLQQKSVDYSALDISPDKLSNEMNCRLAELNGFNVTIPHKEAIISLLDSVDESALKYNAVNCVLRRDGKTFGCSTDAYGFTQALKANGVPLSGKVLVLGSGGAARTLARETCDSGCELVISVRADDLPKAHELKAWLSDNGGKVSVCEIKDLSGDFDLCVNATPVGMYPNTDAMVISEEQLSHCKALFDAVYNPQKTKLIKTAESMGIKTVGGMAMLVWQAVKAHEFWYNAKFNVADIEKIIDGANEEMARLFYGK